MKRTQPEFIIENSFNVPKSLLGAGKIHNTFNYQAGQKLSAETTNQWTLSLLWFKNNSKNSRNNTLKNL